MLLRNFAVCSDAWWFTRGCTHSSSLLVFVDSRDSWLPRRCMRSNECGVAAVNLEYIIRVASE